MRECFFICGLEDMANVFLAHREKREKEVNKLPRKKKLFFSFLSVRQNRSAPKASFNFFSSFELLAHKKAPQSGALYLKRGNVYPKYAFSALL